ncbi:MAG: hypothetical protein CMI30_11785 [Opitutae bacterium]|nr:hypothetical protein [Opitutae bacterium]|tara:strand:- start:249 stop:806 length:558 start_codon:yes stop_codon:yes gene_type:complete
MKPLGIYLLLAGSCMLFGIGLVAPVMTVTPPSMEDFAPDNALGGLTDLLGGVFGFSLGDGDEWESTTYTILSVIEGFFNDGDVALGLFLVFFSILFPVAKLCALWRATVVISNGKDPGNAFRLIDGLSKFSLVEVLVVAVVVTALKGLPLNIEVLVRWGLWVFVGSIFLGAIASLFLRRQVSFED